VIHQQNVPVCHHGADEEQNKVIRAKSTSNLPEVLMKQPHADFCLSETLAYEALSFQFQESP